jgi:hypothetical protein
LQDKAPRVAALGYVVRNSDGDYTSGAQPFGQLQIREPRCRFSIRLSLQAFTSCSSCATVTRFASEAEAAVPPSNKKSAKLRIEGSSQKALKR